MWNQNCLLSRADLEMQMDVVWNMGVRGDLGGQLGVKQPHVVRSWLRLANQSFVVVGWIMDMA